LDRQLNLRVSASEMDRLEQLAETLTRRNLGVSINKSAAARAAIIRGLDALEAELGASEAAQPKKRRSRT